MKTFFLLIGLVLGSVRFAEAQQPKAPRIGFLVAGPASAVANRVEAFREGLRERGYIEGKTFSLSTAMAKAKSIASPNKPPS